MPEIESAEVSAPGYNAYFYYEDNDVEHAVWFLDVVTFLNELREVRKQGQAALPCIAWEPKIARFGMR